MGGNLFIYICPSYKEAGERASAFDTSYFGENFTKYKKGAQLTILGWYFDHLLLTLLLVREGFLPYSYRDG